MCSSDLGSEYTYMCVLTDKLNKVGEVSSRKSVINIKLSIVKSAVVSVFLKYRLLNVNM